MRFKMIIVFVEDDKTEEIMVAARKAGATGATVINNAPHYTKETALFLTSRSPLPAND